ncbi:hypothetical protein Trydic_g17688 [Trypoxylus dichotomus]
MTDIDIHTRQRSGIEFLNAKGETVDAGTVTRWIRRCSNTATQDKHKPLTAVTPRKIQRVNDIIRDDFHLFGSQKEAHRGIHYQDQEAVKTSVR